MKHGYSSLQIALHWLVLVLVVVNLLLGQSMARVFEARHGGEAVVSAGPAYAHIAIGVTILLTMIARLAARLSRPVATAPDTPHRLLATLGRINHWAFYAMLLLIPLLGAIAWFGDSEAAGELHGLAIVVLLVLIAIHVSAALFHHFVLGDGLIRRMLRPTGGT